MAFVQNNFYDPVASTSYDWHINHAEEEGPSRPDNISAEGKQAEDDSPSQLVQGAGDALKIVLSGTILHSLQYKKFWEFKGISNSFRYTSYHGDEFEVTMSGLEMTKNRVNYNPQDASMRFHTWSYTMVLTILSINAGDLYDAGVTA